MQQEHSSHIHSVRENLVKQVILLLFLRNTARMTIHLFHGYMNMKELNSVVGLIKNTVLQTSIAQRKTAGNDKKWVPAISYRQPQMFFCML